MMKDHYKTLGVPFHATPGEIKQAYRKLVMKYHPDKNKEKGAPSVFGEIREAYETLMSPVKKEEYLQQRWYYQSQGKTIKNSGIQTPYTILKETITLNRYISNQDAFRINKDKILQELTGFLNTERIGILNDYDDKTINDEIVYLLLKSTSYLNREQLKLFSERLMSIRSSAADLPVRIKELLKQKERSRVLEKLAPWFITFITGLLCFLIYLFSK